MGSVAVLDLDETLVHAINRKECGNPDNLLWTALCNYASQKCHTKNMLCFFNDIYFVFVRPGAVAALQHCRKTFQLLVIFTAGNESHAKYIKKMLFEDIAHVLVDFVFHRDNCGKFASMSQETTLVPYQKNLCHVREIVEKAVTEEQRRKINWQYCLFVEDLSYNALTNSSETLIVPKFDYPSLTSLLKKETAAETNIDEASNDDVLQRLVHFIEKKQDTKALWQMIDKRFAMFV